MSSENSVTSPPDAVRVWRGFRLQTLQPADFYKSLGTVFIPATVKFQIDAGLHSYTPAVLAGLDGKPDYVPDETAILFWKSQETYWNGFKCLAVRTYTLTHGGVYVTTGSVKSGADFPVPFKDPSSLIENTPVFLFDKEADWMNGAVRHIVAERPRNVTPEEFQASVAEALKKIQGLSRDLQGAIACIGTDYLVYWELGQLAPGVQNPVSGMQYLLPILTGWRQVLNPAATFLPIGIYDAWAGMDVVAGSSFNMQFTRNASI